MHTLEELRAGALQGVPRLDLAEGFTEFPREIYSLADSLEVLNLSGNQLTSLPDDLPRLHRLRILFCSGNRFTELPPVLGRCPLLSMVGFKANQIRTLPAAALPPALRWLILTDNELGELPPEIGQCGHLQKLMLAGNRLTHLPPALAQCRRLELLRLAANRLANLPLWLFALPRLSWLAVAGNPCGEDAETRALAEHPMRAIEWRELTLHERLGEGASGHIYRANWHPANSPDREVALKIFKGAVTSDGLPHSEMVACISAGQHRNLIPLLGKVAGHPQNAEGLVMSLIPPAFSNLAGPPSLATCTRDIYPPGTLFSPKVLARVAHGVAKAAFQLHSQGVMHGDLYGHNILHTLEGEVLLGDFGAASFFDPEDETAVHWQRLEVRAFGCLLEELLERSAAVWPGILQEAQGRLGTLRAHCLDTEPSQRPLFPEIANAIEAVCDLLGEAEAAVHE